MSSREQVVVVGSGICGMFTALAQAKRGHAVTILERDPPPPEGNADAAFFEWNRLGAAQFRHPHAFLGLMCSLIQKHYPELLEEMYAAGARRVELEEMLPAELKPHYVPEPGDENLFVLMCRRATLETVIRRHVGALDNVTIRNRVQVAGILTEQRQGRLVATGVSGRSRDDTSETREDIHADLLIDASGRSSRFPQWLAKLGVNVEEDAESAEIVYYTRHYRLKAGQQEPPRGDNRGAGDLGYIKYGVFPGDNGNFAIILCADERETALIEALRDPERFDAICRSIPGLTPWLGHERSEPTTESFGIGDIRSVWRTFVKDGTPLIDNFFAVGDAALRTNPLYGRGCSTGVMHAQILAEVMDEHSDPVARALAFHARTADELRPIFDASRREDRSGIKRALAAMEGRNLAKPDSLKKWFGVAFGDAMTAAARENIHVLRGLLRTFHLLEKPGDFLKDRRIRWTIYRYMLRGRRRNASRRLQKGPKREEMLAHVAA